ncbi:hypothetical protein CMQ_6225 [Grosmannia clavigera kw1407]|uniref:YCII-related domain-containing protein n=1 Tax=Grosmannia clavigera (strain kw1407 / UAMH 11150) TaxID=655863 RepID=F0XM62_GROCL|nr:uncharacterized protein CMQ_6225 [Grosmannia clavigera kw1407]EFX01283.1 hypothetical protein CMQ_6225 [Grosmannia clavigera kw1407]
MASTSAQSEWLVIIPDYPGTVDKRLEVRGIHLANTKPLRESGVLKSGGAIVDDIPSNPADPTTYKFAGSTLTVVAESRNDVVDLIKKDIYTEKGVWDVEKAQIYWLKSAFRDP